MDKTFLKLGRQFKVWIANRLQRGQGVGGSLRPKKRPDGRKLGGSLPTVIRGGSIKAKPEGFDAKFHSLSGLSLEAFNAGAKGGHVQEARPIIGLTSREQKKAAKVVMDALIKRGKKMKIWK